MKRNFESYQREIRKYICSVRGATWWPNAHSFEPYIRSNIQFIFFTYKKIQELSNSRYTSSSWRCNRSHVSKFEQSRQLVCTGEAIEQVEKKVDRLERRSDGFKRRAPLERTHKHIQHMLERAEESESRSRSERSVHRYTSKPRLLAIGTDLQRRVRQSTRKVAEKQQLRTSAYAHIAASNKIKDI
ncbi:unnamed protein product [Trichogramma brassicae]|uniref:Uncharacterized protein n=1 Tax=Trichogramma brassicae TaxID=86971 RepID=A0A6H5I4J6_9HYME|nr:unnamed protein product [Trichogramma brassicae]